MARKIVAGNWKMNTSYEEASELAKVLSAKSAEIDDDVDIYVFPPYPYLKHLVDVLPSRIRVGAQDCSADANGAYTGEVSAAMLASCGVQAVILGHSERRARFKEDEALLHRKIIQAQKNGLEVFFCIGESQDILAGGASCVSLYHEKLLRALDNGVDLNKVVIAYEPVWAIGTGKSASATYAEEQCAFIHNSILKRWSIEVPILYGGSCNPTNARELFAQEHINGGLIGGASLKADQFLELCRSF